MKKFKILQIALLILIAGSLSMCSKDDKTVAPGILPTQINNAIIDGTWKITLFEEATISHTADFKSYNFGFNVKGTVVATAVVTKEGSWSTIAETGVTKMKLNFTVKGSESNFDSISEDWSIFSATATRIEMKHTNEDKTIDFLTFEKN